MSADRFKKDDTFLVILFVTFVVGLVVAVTLCGIWRYYPGTFNGQMRAAAIAICPPFLLAGILEATSDSTLALIMTMGTIIFANGFLYAGLASFAYFLASVFLRRSR